MVDISSNRCNKLFRLFIPYMVPPLILGFVRNYENASIDYNKELLI